MMAEVSYDEATIDLMMQYYGTEEEPIADFPFNFDIINNFKNRSDVNGFALKKSITQWLDNMPAGKWANWVVSFETSETYYSVRSVIQEEAGIEI